LAESVIQEPWTTSGACRSRSGYILAASCHAVPTMSDGPSVTWLGNTGSFFCS